MHLRHCPFNAFPFLQTDTLPEENRSGDGNSSTRKKVALFLSQLNCTLLQEGAEAKLAKDLFSKKPYIDFSISKKLSDIATNFLFIYFFSKILLFFQLSISKIRIPSDPDPASFCRVHFCILGLPIRVQVRYRILPFLRILSFKVGLVLRYDTDPDWHQNKKPYPDLDRYHNVDSSQHSFSRQLTFFSFRKKFIIFFHFLLHHILWQKVDEIQPSGQSV